MSDEKDLVQKTQAPSDLSYRLWFASIIALFALIAGLILTGAVPPAAAVLLAYFVYMSLACTFIPLPTAWIILWLSGNFSPLLVALLGAVGTVIANLNDYYLFSFFLRYRHINRIRETELHKKALRWFYRAPFPTLAAATFLPIPLDFVRFLAISGRYPRWKFTVASFVGRFPRYLLLAYIGYELKLGRTAILIVLGVTAAVGITKFAISHLGRMLGKAKEGAR